MTFTYDINTDIKQQIEQQFLNNLPIFVEIKKQNFSDIKEMETNACYSIHNTHFSLSNPTPLPRYNVTPLM